MVKNIGRKIVTMYGATLLTVFIGFLISIFNSRVLGPESFGDFKFIETVARFVASLVSIGLFISIARLLAMNEEKDKERKYIGLFTIIFGIASIIGILLYLIFSFIEPYFFNADLGSSIYRYFFIVMVIIGHFALQELLKGLHKIYTLSYFGILPLFIYLAFVYTLNLFIPVNIDIVLFAYYGILLLFIIIILSGLKPNFKFKKSLLEELLIENKYNGRPIYFGSLAGVATGHIAGLSISYFMNNTQVGFFLLSLTVCGPLLIIPSVLGTIYFKEFVSLNSIPSKVIYLSISGTVLALVLFYLLIEWAIITFYTEAYLPVSNISKYLIIAFIFHGFGDMINRFLGAKGKGKQLRNAAFLVGIINVIGYTMLVKYFDINGAITTKILASCLYLVAMIFYYINFIKKNNV